MKIMKYISVKRYFCSVLKMYAGMSRYIRSLAFSLSTEGTVYTGGTSGHAIATSSHSSKEVKDCKDVSVPMRTSINGMQSTPHRLKIRLFGL